MNHHRKERIEILFGDNDYVDFAYPALMTNDELLLFIGLLKTIFDPRVVVTAKVEKHFRDWRIGERVMYPRQWTPEEYAVLLEKDTTEETVHSLGRSWMATQLKEADWRYRFLSWCSKGGRDLANEDKLSVIKDFMKDQNEFRLSRKKLSKELKQIKEELQELQSESRATRTKILRRLGKITDQHIDEENARKDSILSRIKEIELELVKKFDDI